MEFSRYFTVKMDASEYKSYLLGLVFYKYLSDKMLYYAADVLEEPTNDVKKAYQIYDKAYNDNDLHDDLLANIKDEFFIVLSQILHLLKWWKVFLMEHFNLKTLLKHLEILKPQVRYMKTCLRM